VGGARGGEMWQQCYDDYVVPEWQEFRDFFRSSAESVFAANRERVKNAVKARVAAAAPFSDPAAWAAAFGLGVEVATFIVESFPNCFNEAWAIWMAQGAYAAGMAAVVTADTKLEAFVGLGEMAVAIGLALTAAAKAPVECNAAAQRACTAAPPFCPSALGVAMAAIGITESQILWWALNGVEGLVAIAAFIDKMENFTANIEQPLDGEFQRPNPNFESDPDWQPHGVLDWPQPPYGDGTYRFDPLPR